VAAEVKDGWCLRAAGDQNQRLIIAAPGEECAIGGVRDGARVRVR